MARRRFAASPTVSFGITLTPVPVTAQNVMTVGVPTSVTAESRALSAQLLASERLIALLVLADVLDRPLGWLLLARMLLCPRPARRRRAHLGVRTAGRIDGLVASQAGTLGHVRP